MEFLFIYWLILVFIEKRDRIEWNFGSFSEVFIGFHCPVILWRTVKYPVNKNKRKFSTYMQKVLVFWGNKFFV